MKPRSMVAVSGRAGAVAGFAVSSLLWCVTPLAAHELRAVATVDSEGLRVDVRFEGGAVVGDALVEVRSSGGEIVASGRTDASGRYRFPRPPDGGAHVPGDLTVVVEDGHGHRAMLEIAADDLARALGAPAPRTTPLADSSLALARYAPFWLRVAIGVGLIAVFSLAVYLVAVRWKRGHAS